MQDSAETSITWQATNFRLSCFLSGNQDLDDVKSTWWPQLVGQEPENEVDRIRESAWQADGSILHGDWRKARLTVRLLKDSRIDWLLDAEPTDDSGLGEEYIATLSDGLPPFLDMMRRWLSTNPPDIKRIALGTVLRVPVVTREEGYQLLSTRFLPFAVDPATASELFYRINRFAPSHALQDGTLLNRIMTWSVQEVRIVGLTLTAGAIVGQQPQRGDVFTSCRLELDINTGADRESRIPAEQVSPLLDELQQTALMIAERGDHL